MYKVEISSDGKTWTTIAASISTEQMAQQIMVDYEQKVLKQRPMFDKHAAFTRVVPHKK